MVWVPTGNVGDREGPGRIADVEIGVRHHANVLGHPAVQIATDPEHPDLFIQSHLVHHALNRLADVEGVCRGGQAVEIVQQRVTVLHLHALTGPEPRRLGARTGSPSGR